MRKVNLIPMAGTGLRFKKRGYKLPKPLIKINNIPMFVKSVRSLPDCDLLIFICLKEHILKFNIDKHIKYYFPKAKIIIFLRYQPDWLLSCYKQSIHSGDCQSIENFLNYKNNKFKKAKGIYNSNGFLHTNIYKVDYTTLIKK